MVYLPLCANTIPLRRLILEIQSIRDTTRFNQLTIGFMHLPEILFLQMLFDLAKSAHL